MESTYKGEAKEKAEAFADAMAASGRAENGAGAPSRPSGVVNAMLVRSVFFVVFSVGIFITAAACIMSVWDYATLQLASRVLMTFSILIVALGLFTITNEALAGKVSLWQDDL